MPSLTSDEETRELAAQVERLVKEAAYEARRLGRALTNRNIQRVNAQIAEPGHHDPPKTGGDNATPAGAGD